MRTLWVLLPAFNEEASLPRLVPRLAETLGERGQAYRIVVVDDGSADSTADVLDDYRRTVPLDVVTHTLNRGLGETERDGFEYVAAHCEDDDVVVRLDCDDTHDPSYVLALMKKLDEGYDVVSTSRFQPGGGQEGVDGYRAAVSRAANLFMRVLFGIPGLRDYSCGFRIYRCRVLRDALRIYGNMFIQLRGLGFTSTLETVVKLHLLGCRFAEVPFVLRYDRKPGPSKMIASVTTLGYFVMAVLYHWPFGGWRSQYRGLARAYRQDPEAAVMRYGLASIRRRFASRIAF